MYSLCIAPSTMTAMKYGNYDPSPPTESEIEHNAKIHAERQSRIAQYAKDKYLTLLESDYMSMDSYYYNKSLGFLYMVCNIGGLNPIFNEVNDTHILKLNNLPVNDNHILKPNAPRIREGPEPCSWLNPINTRI